MEIKKITIYTKDNCSSCQLVKRRLREWGYEFTERNIDRNFEALGDYYFYNNGTHNRTPLIVLDGKDGLLPEKAYRILKETRNENNK